MLHIQDHSGITVLRLDHGKAHALDIDLCRALQQALAERVRDDSVRALVLTGTGSIFCAGVDLFRLIDGGADYIDEFVPLLVATFHELFAFPQPVVAAINGHAIAGGCVLAAASDYRIMADGSGTIGVPELRVGVPFPLVAIEILRFATSTAHLQELVYGGKTYTAAEAHGRGLVDEVVPSGELLDQARETAARLSSDPIARFRITKRQLRRPAIERMERLAAQTDAEVLAAWKNAVTLGAIRSYLDGLRKQ